MLEPGQYFPDSLINLRAVLKEEMDSGFYYGILGGQKIKLYGELYIFMNTGRWGYFLQNGGTACIEACMTGRGGKWEFKKSELTVQYSDKVFAFNASYTILSLSQASMCLRLRTKKINGKDNCR